MNIGSLRIEYAQGIDVLTHNDNLGRNSLEYALYSKDGRSVYVRMAQCEVIYSKMLWLYIHAPI